MQIYSFRAECSLDVERFQAEVRKTQLSVEVGVMRGEAPYPDREVEFQSAASLEELRNTMRNVEDGHVMLQTLRPVPLAHNNLNRDDTLR